MFASLHAAVLVTALATQSHTEPIDSTHSLLLLDWKPATRIPSNNYYAAIVAAQTAIFADFRTSSTPFIADKFTEYKQYGVEISFDNDPRSYQLTYGLIADALGVLASFMLRRRVCEVTWAISVSDQPTGIFISHGAIVKDPFAIGTSPVPQVGGG